MTAPVIAHCGTSRNENRMSRFSLLLDRTSTPLGFEGGDTNLYRYVGNNPINRIDPSGNDIASMSATNQAESPSRSIAAQDEGQPAVNEYAQMLEELEANSNKLQKLNWAQYRTLKDAGFEIGRFDGVYDYVYLQIGDNYYVYTEPSDFRSKYRLIEVYPKSISLGAIDTHVENLNWGVGLGVTDVLVSVIPGGSTAGHIEEGEYGWAALAFVQDVVETALVVGKLGKLEKLSELSDVQKLTKLRATAALTEGIIAGANVYGAASSFSERENVAGAIHTLDALFSVLGVRFNGKEFMRARNKAAESIEQMAAARKRAQDMAEQAASAAKTADKKFDDAAEFSVDSLNNAPKGLAEGVEQLLEIGKSTAKLKLENGVLKVSDIYVQGDSMLEILDHIRKVGKASGAKNIEVTAEFLNFPLRDRLMKMGLNFEKIGEGVFGDIWKITGGL